MNEILQSLYDRKSVRRSCWSFWRMFAEVHPEETFDYDRFMKAFCARKYQSAFTVEMNRSIGKYLEQYASGEK